MLVKANRVPISTYRKSTFRIPMIWSLCSAPHDKKDNDVERSPAETLFMVHSSQTATSTEVETFGSCRLPAPVFSPLLHSKHCTAITLCQYHLRPSFRKTKDKKKRRGRLRPQMSRPGMRLPPVDTQHAFLPFSFLISLIPKFLSILCTIRKPWNNSTPNSRADDQRRITETNEKLAQSLPRSN